MNSVRVWPAPLRLCLLELNNPGEWGERWLWILQGLKLHQGNLDSPWDPSILQQPGSCVAHPICPFHSLHCHGHAPYSGLCREVLTSQI